MVTVAFFTFGFLLLLLAAAHYWPSATAPDRSDVSAPALADSKPLDQEGNYLLPAPWAGHASSVFSLTALFGAYFGVILLVGFIAGIGLAVGSTLALLLIRRRVRILRLNSQDDSFEHFFGRLRFSNSEPLNLGLWLLILLNLLGFAASEVVILRELVFHGFSTAPHHATVFAILVALLGYYYCLIGGYAAVYRTDLVQLFAVVAMCIGLMWYALWPVLLDLTTLHTPSAVWRTTEGYWTFPWVTHPLANHLYQLSIGLIMGMGFLLASPDAWKRVFTIMRDSNQKHFSFRAMVLAGFVPFLLLIPLLLSLPADFVQQFGQGVVVKIPRNPIFVSSAVIGMVASFLSSFDSMLVTATHVGLVRKPLSSRLQHLNSIHTYRTLLATFLLVVLFAAVGLISGISNPYFLANLLLGPFAIAAALVFGTQGFRRQIRWSISGWLVLLSLVGWALYLMSQRGITAAPHPDQIDTVPVGAGLFLLVSALVFSTSKTSEETE